MQIVIITTHLEVRDNGREITKDEIDGAKSLGLPGMRERALVFGGESVSPANPEREPI